MDYIQTTKYCSTDHDIREINSVVGKQFQIVRSQIVQNDWFYDEIIRIEVLVPSKVATRMTVIWHFSNSLFSNVFFTKYSFFYGDERQTFYPRTFFYSHDITLCASCVVPRQTDRLCAIERFLWDDRDGVTVYGLRSHQAFSFNVVWSWYRKHGVRLMMARWSRCTTMIRFLSTSHFCRILSLKICECCVSFYRVCVNPWLSPTFMLSHITSHNQFQPVRWPIAIVYLVHFLRHRYHHNNADVKTDSKWLCWLTLTICMISYAIFNYIFETHSCWHSILFLARL